LTVDFVKTQSMYHTSRINGDQYTLEILPADIHYSAEFKRTLNDRIEKMIMEHNQKVNEKIIGAILEEPRRIILEHYR
ncbi:hypothetical protein ABTF44_22960, partial [Acinetobacter baumannii]